MKPLPGALLLLLALLPSALAAQNPPPRPPRPDTARVDTTRAAPKDSAEFRVPAEALPQDTFRTLNRDTVPADSLVPAPVFPQAPRPDSAGGWSGTWEWSREELLRFQGTSLLELLARVPGVVVTRGGGFGQPVGVSPFALGGGRTRLFLEGWEVDPLSAAALDVQQLSPLDLESLRVERRLHELRIHLTLFRLPDRRPYSRVEAATGDPETRYLRGLYAQALGRMVLTLGFDLTDTRGFRSQPFGVTTGVARLDYLLSPRAGVQLELRQTGVERAQQLHELGDRRDVLLRARWEPTSALFLEGVAGRASRAPAGELDRFRSAEVDQLGARALLRAGPAWVEGEARFRRGSDAAFPVPESDLAVRGGLRPLPFLEAQGEARLASVGERGGTELWGAVRVGPFAGVSLFGSATAGTRGLGLLAGDTVLPLPPDTAGNPREDTVPRFGTVSSTLAGVRAGAEWSRPGAAIGAALLLLDPDRVVPLGLRFEPDTLPAAETGASTGVEGYVSTPLLPSLRLEGGFTYWSEGGERPYLPDHEGRAALEFNRLYYTGNLEPTLRLEAVRRGAALVPPGVSAGTIFDVQPTPYTLLNFYAQVRVIDVRAFVLFENLLNYRLAADVPTGVFPGARVLYGVRWHFRN